MATTPLVVLGNIMTLVGAGEALYSAYEVANAKDTITIDDAVRLVNSTNVKLFAGQQFSNIRTARTDFYDTYLPSVTSKSSIKKDEIVEPGYLAQTYKSIIDGEKTVWESLQQLDWIFSNNDLHIDDYNFFARLFGQGYALLLHMHSILVHLRSVELLDKLDLDDYRLLPETLRLLSFISKILEQVDNMNSKVRTLRLGKISQVQTKFDSTGTSATLWWDDNYEKLGSTASDQAIDGSKVSGHCVEMLTAFSDPTNSVNQKRQDRVDYITNIYTALTGEFLEKLLKDTKTLKVKIDARKTKQEAAKKTAEEVCSESLHA
ncbi:uncharacterized protein FIBRA_01861 [Fibroporia radiculosa]|uniref:Uncharacterized protein n=1 Tax=Fibroporia radiculosa TaxID=599839 RepID=J4HU01_9APHY|nr:uncharacterized protein FIBRA_01861 [Fibroporia radiculosa]CCL99837.1 predicted protein [Fibroporia radiculosa]